MLYRKISNLIENHLKSDSKRVLLIDDYDLLSIIPIEVNLVRITLLIVL